MPKSRKRKVKKKGASYRSTYSPGKKTKRKAVLIALAIVGVLALAGVVFLATSGDKGGLKIEDLVIGTGASPQPGQTIRVLYTGTLENGTVFDKSTDPANPYSTVFGTGAVIKGWDQGIAGMKVGGKRRLTVPPELGYGEKGFSTRVPPNATLIFEVELVSVQ